MNLINLEKQSDYHTSGKASGAGREWGSAL